MSRINEQERKFQYALELAIEGGVLINCPYHEGSIYLGNEEIESAYKLANSKWTSGKINPDFFRQCSHEIPTQRAKHLI